MSDELGLRRGRKLGDDKFEHAMVDEADQTELLGDRHHVGRQHQLAVGRHDARRDIRETRVWRVCAVDHRLEYDHGAAIVQRRERSRR